MKKRSLAAGRLVIADPGRVPIKDGAVLIEDGRIAAVDTKARLISAVAKDEILDCGESVLFPGMIDCHNHLSLDCALNDYLAKMNDAESDLTLRAVHTLAVDLKSGVTTARCLGDKFFLDVKVKRAVDEGRLAGPRLLVATRGLRASAGHGFVGIPCDGPEDLRKTVRENILRGADLIKFYATGTLLNKGFCPCYYSEEEIAVIVGEAKRVGLRTAVHCIGGLGLELCLAAGADTIEHGYYISDREIELFLKSRSTLVLTPSEFLANKPTLAPERAEAFRRDRDLVRERMAAVVRSGIPYAAGTDGMHGRLADEVRYIAEAGARPADALGAVTTRAAAVCGLEDELGSLDPGKLADIVALSGNPLEDIGALERVNLVIKDGEIVYRRD